MRTKQYSGFTLVEMLIVIGVIGVLASIIIGVINPVTQFERLRIAQAKSFQGQVVRNLGFNEEGVWTFDDTAAPVADTSGNNRNGTIIGATYIADCGQGLGGCFSFDGADDYINVPGSWLNEYQTVMLWAKPANGWASASGRIISSLRFSSPDHDGFFFSASPNTMQFGIYNNSQPEFFYNAPVTGDGWHHFALTWTPTLTRAYVDGKLVRTVSRTNDFTSNTSTLNVGRYNYLGNQYFDGQVDEVYIFNEALPTN